MNKNLIACLMVTFVILFMGCGSKIDPALLDKVGIRMSEQKVISILGKPNSTGEDARTKILIYELKDGRRSSIHIEDDEVLYISTETRCNNCGEYNVVGSYMRKPCSKCGTEMIGSKVKPRS